MNSTFGSSLINSSTTVSPSMAEPAEKRQRETQAQFDEGNLVCEMTAEECKIFIERELSLLLEYDRSPPDSVNSDHVTVTQSNSSTASSSIAEPPQKRQRITGSQFDEGNPIAELTDEESTISTEEELPLLRRIFLDCVPSPLNSTNSDHVVTMQSRSEGGTSKVACGDTHVMAPPSIMREAQTNAEETPSLEQRPLSRARILVVKELSYSDVETHFTGIKLPKKIVEKHFLHIPEGSEGLPVTIYDGVVDGKTWKMKVTVSHKPGEHSKTSATYTLKDTFHYVKNHCLEEGDWLKIFLEEPACRYIATFEKSSTEYIPPSHQHHLLGKTWKVIMRKMLSKNDCKLRPRSVGAIGLQRDQVEKHLPPLQNKTGNQMTFYDWNLVQTWAMTVKFSPHRKGRIYRLDNTATFCALHNLQEDDWVDMLKSDEPNPSFALRAWKSGDFL